MNSPAPRPRLSRVLVRTIIICSAVLCQGAAFAATSPQKPVAKSAAASRIDRVEALSDWVDRECEKHRIPGLAMVVIAGKNVVLEKLCGYADTEHKHRVTRQTVFPIGSSSKPFTSTLAAMLKSDGVLDWDDPVTRYLPYFKLPIDSPDEKAQVTLRDLLAHRTGFFTMKLLQDAVNWQQDPEFDPAEHLSREGMLRAATKFTAVAPFRSKHNYSNVSMLAAAMACGEAADKDWDKLMVERMFKPLGMKDSSTSISSIRKGQRVANGHLGMGEKMKPSLLINMDVVSPAGGLNSTLEDMTTWVKFLLARGVHDGRRLVDEKALDETWASQVAGADLGGQLPGAKYGMGWFVRSWKDHAMVEHGGNALGYSAFVALIPKRGVGVVMLSNVLPNPLQMSLGEKVWQAVVDQE